MNGVLHPQRSLWHVCRLGSIKLATCLFSTRAIGSGCTVTHCMQSDKICSNLVGCIPHCHCCILSHLHPREEGSAAGLSSGALPGPQQVSTLSRLHLLRQLSSTSLQLHLSTLPAQAATLTKLMPGLLLGATAFLCPGGPCCGPVRGCSISEMWTLDREGASCHDQLLLVMGRPVPCRSAACACRELRLSSSRVSCPRSPC